MIKNSENFSVSKSLLANDLCLYLHRQPGHFDLVDFALGGTESCALAFGLGDTVGLVSGSLDRLCILVSSGSKKRRGQADCPSGTGTVPWTLLAGRRRGPFRRYCVGNSLAEIYLP